MKSSLMVAAVIGAGAVALTGSLATAMPVAKLAEVSKAQAQVETVGWCRRARPLSYAWYLRHRYDYSGTLLYFGPRYVYGNRKAGW